MPDPLTATFAALADPTRRAILARLATSDCSVTERGAVPHLSPLIRYSSDRTRL